MKRLSLIRLWAIMLKEFLQLKRDKGTFGMAVMMPLMQLIIFGFAINNNPKNLPMVIVSADHSAFIRTIVTAMENTHYFQIINDNASVAEAQQMLREGKTLFVLHIPPNFTRELVRGKQPNLLLQADATDPVATANAISATNYIVQNTLSDNLVGSLANLKPQPPPIGIIVHAVYNPLLITQYNIVPGLLGVVLTMTLVMITALAITRERERGTMENLLATPVRPLEVIVGKIVPYIILGYVQVAIVLLIGTLLFHIPHRGSILLLCLMCLPFIAANLSVGLMFSTIAKNQLQAVQSTLFFFLPSILLSGFMFPFRGMPIWAQYLGNILPMTHFLVMVRGILLKGNGFIQIWPALWPIMLFTLMVILIGMRRYKQTLD